MAEMTHKVEIVRVSVEPHSNADRLDICRIFGFTCCVAKGSFQDGQLAAYIQPDSVVDSTRPEFEFLAGHERIKVKRLRGVVSMGLLMPAPEGAKEGDDVAEYYGVTHKDVEFSITAFGTEEENEERWQNRDKLIGKIIKYKYQKYGSKDKPRIATGIGFRSELDL